MVRRVGIFRRETIAITALHIQAISDKSFGTLMLSAAAAAFGYYTVWTILLVSGVSAIVKAVVQERQPFFDAASPVHDWFPSREWAVRIPAFILVLGLSAIGILFGLEVIQEHGGSYRSVKDH